MNMNDASSILPSGATLQGGKYRIIRVLGQGGFGITYLAEQTGLGMKVAIKEFFLKGSCQRDATTSRVSVPVTDNKELVAKCLKKFKSEARKIASLNNDHIVSIIDIFDENGTSYYVMKYLDGGSLADRIKSGPMPEKEALDIIKNVAEALNVVHSNGLLHLDVKPANILFDNQGRSVLIDFGVSKYFDTQNNTATTSSLIGFSRGFAPLEQINAIVASLSPATDIYSLGATLYNLVVGITPPDASSVMEGGLPAFPVGISVEVQHAIEQSMRPRRIDRPQDVHAFLSILDSETVDNGNQTDETVVIHKNSSSYAEDGLRTDSSVVERSKFRWRLPILALSFMLCAVFAFGELKGGFSGFLSGKSDNIVQDSLVINGSIIIASNPAGAGIWLDSSFTNKYTPDTLYDISPGIHRIRIASDGYYDSEDTVRLEAGGQCMQLFKELLIKKQEAEIERQKQEPILTVSGRIAGHDFVDMGLSVKWATCNVGTTTPSGYGTYFAWGETSPKSEYNIENYKFLESGDYFMEAHYLKYVINSKNGVVDNKKRLDPEDDAAHVHWGGSWRMPTLQELEELSVECEWKVATYGGRKGFIVTSKKNGNSLFLPAAGYKMDKEYNWRGRTGDYWTSSLDEKFSFDAYHRMAMVENPQDNCFSTSRTLGMTIRPVSN